MCRNALKFLSKQKQLLHMIQGLLFTLGCGNVASHEKVFHPEPEFIIRLCHSSAIMIVPLRIYFNLHGGCRIKMCVEAS